VASRRLMGFFFAGLTPFVALPEGEAFGEGLSAG
jgi:hypothetical protein